jgi:hypothetical protein
MAAIFLPFIMINFKDMLEEDPDVDLSDPTKWEAIMKWCYNKDEYKELLQKYLVNFDNKGFLDL